MEMLRTIFSLAIGVLGCSIAYAQTVESQDSLMKKLDLKEVIINSDQPAKKSTRFYQTSKLSSTEDILARLEGVSMIRRGPIGMEPTIRGFSSGQVNLVLDGMKVFGACTDKMDPVSIYVEPMNLQKIGVEHGASGLEMGSSIGGTINLGMADAKVLGERNFSGSVTTGFHSAAKAFQNTLVTNYSDKEWALRFAGTHRKADNYKDGKGHVVPYSQYEKANFSLSSRYNLSDNSFLKADFIWDDGWGIGYPALPMDVGSAKARIGSLSLKRFFDDGNLEQYELKAYANSVRHKMDDSNRPDVFMRMDMPGNSQTQGAFFNLKMKPMNKHQFGAKVDVYHNYVIADMTMYPENGEPMYMLTWPGNHQTVAGLYLSDHVMLNQTNHLDLYFRTEMNVSSLASEIGINQLEVLGYDVSKTQTSLLKNGGIGYKNNINEHHSLSLNLGYTERMPTTSERYGFYLYNRMDNHDYIGNPDLKKEKALNVEMSSLYAKDGLVWKLSAFGNRIQDYILGKTQSSYTAMTYGAQGVRQYQNVNAAYLFGAESSFNIVLKEKLTLNNSIKWIRGVEQGGENLPMISPLKSYTHIRYSFTHLFLQVENELSLAQNQISKTYGEFATPAYNIVNLRGNYHMKLNNKDLEFSLGMENVFNTSYFEHLDWGRVLRPGRNVYGMITFKL